MMIALYGATIGKLGVLTIEAATNQAVCGIFVPKEVETKYLFYFLLQHRRELIELGAGGAQPNISQGIIRDVKVPLPTLPEQRQIVAEIEARFTVVDHLEAELDRQINRSIRLRQSALASAFKGEL
jgi:type I restriction enzyme S subunit